MESSAPTIPLPATTAAERSVRLDALPVATILFLGLADLFLATSHLAHGGSIDNPIMAWVLANGGLFAFQAVKLAPIILGLAILVFRARLGHARRFVTMAAVFYTLAFAGQIIAGMYL